MTITYRTRRRLHTAGIVGLVFFLVAIIAWFCWVVWLERYVVYTRDGATLDFDLPAQMMGGEVALPPEAPGEVSIYYNEGADAIENIREMSVLNGYYIDYNMLSRDLAGVMENLKYVRAGTPVMIEMKGGYGSFYYSSTLAEAVQSASVPIAAVDSLVQELKSRGYYTIAKVSAFQDYCFGNNHVTSGLYMLSRAGLWMDDEGCFWLDPTNATVLSWITSVVNELKSMGFHEVMLANFRFPNSDKYIYNGDKAAALTEAAQKLVTSTQADTFVLSFGASSADFALPEGRTRLYLSDVKPENIGTTVSATTFEEKNVRLVFTGSTNDTRYDEYGILRPITAAEAIEARKADEEG